MLIAEHLDSTGRAIRVELTCQRLPSGESVARLDSSDGISGHLPVAVVAAVMRRYGRPLDDGVTLSGPLVEFGGGTLHHVRYRAQVDADGRDYLVWDADGELLAALSNGVAAALRHLVARMGERRR